MIFALIGSEIVAFGGKCKPGIHRGADSLSAQHADAQIGGDRGRIGKRSFEPRKDSRIDGLNDGADDERRLEIKIALRDFAAAHGLADHQAENRIGVPARRRHALQVLMPGAEDIGDEQPILVEILLLSRAARARGRRDRFDDGRSLYGRNLLDKVTDGVNSPLPASLGGGSFRTLNKGRVIGIEASFTY
jgi:hypothetical protein